MKALENYAIKNLAAEILAIQNSGRNEDPIEINLYEKAVIYKYTDDGYESINEALRKSDGKSCSQLGVFLIKALNKLPDFEGLVYRSVNLSPKELERYSIALRDNRLLKEHAFLSTSKSRLTAMAFNGNVLFRMYSRTGKEIENIARFGKYNPPNEREVLFKPNRNFRILEITNEASYTLITMEEA